MSGVQQKFDTVPGVNIHLVAHTITSGRVIVSFDFEGRADRFRASAIELAEKGFASFVRVGTQGNPKVSSRFGPEAARAVLDFVLQHPGALTGTSRGLMEIYLIGTSEAAGAVAAIASEFEQVSKILLIDPDLETTPQATEGISRFIGDVAILDRDGLDSALLETCADVARSCRSAVVPAMDERVISLAPFWAFFSTEPSIPSNWQGLAADDGPTIPPPTDRVRIAQLRAKLREYESPVKQVANPEKKLWALCQVLRRESVSHRDLSMTFFRDAPKDVEATFSTVALQCSAQAKELEGVDQLLHPLELGYWISSSEGNQGRAFTINLARRIRPGQFQDIEAVPIGDSDSGVQDYGARNAATSLLEHYQGHGGPNGTSPQAVATVADKLAQGGGWFLPITYLEDLLVGFEAKGANPVVEADPLTA